VADEAAADAGQVIAGGAVDAPLFGWVHDWVHEWGLLVGWCMLCTHVRCALLVCNQVAARAVVPALLQWQHAHWAQ
jgi:hypothetical protein